MNIRENPEKKEKQKNEKKLLTNGEQHDIMSRLSTTKTRTAQNLEN